MDRTAELTHMLFGVGASELVSKLDKGKTLTPEEQRKKSERLQGRIALGSNAVGLAAGIAGTGAALRDDRFEEGGKWSKKIYAGGKKIPNPISGKKGKAGAALAGGALALQVGNIGGDIVANRVLARSQKRIEKRAKGYLVPVATGTGGLAAGGMAGYHGRKAKSAVRKSEPGSSDVMTPGKLKRLAATKAFSNGKTGAEKSAGYLKTLNTTPQTSAGTVEVFERGKGKTNVQKNQEKAAYNMAAWRKAGNKGVPPIMPRGGLKPVKKNVSTDITWEGEFSKVNDEKRQVFGWASIVELNGEPVVDLQGDYIDIDEIEKSAYDYVIKSRKGGEMHRRDGELPVHVSDMIESFIVTPEKKEKLGLPDSMPTGWWVGYQINDDEAWNLVKSGKRTGFSIHGRGQRTPTEM